MSRSSKSAPSSQGIPLNILIVLVFSGLLFMLPALAKNESAANEEIFKNQEIALENRHLIFHGNTLSPFHTFSDDEEPPVIVVNDLVIVDDKKYVVARIHKTTITAYSSTVDQTDSSPFVTASGSWVEDGIVAANFLPFGTKIRIPEYFGDRIFVVKDRMNRRFDNRVDIWFETRSQAIDFGITYTDIEILEEA